MNSKLFWRTPQGMALCGNLAKVELFYQSQSAKHQICWWCLRFLLHWWWLLLQVVPSWCQNWPWSLCLFAAPLKYHNQGGCKGLWGLCKLHISRLQVRQFRCKYYLFYGLPIFPTKCDKERRILWPLSLHYITGLWGHFSCHTIFFFPS